MDIHYVIINLLMRVSRNPLESSKYIIKKEKYSPEKKSQSLKPKEFLAENKSEINEVNFFKIRDKSSI